MRFLTRRRRAGALIMTSIMVLAVFVGMNFAMAEEPMTDGSRQYQYAPPVNYTMTLGWHEGDLVKTWDFGMFDNQVMPIYQLFYNNGTEVDQPPILRYIPDGIFEGHSGDPEYSPFVLFMNVSVPDDYVINSTQSFDDITTNAYTYNWTGLTAVGLAIPTNSTLVNDPNPGEKGIIEFFYDGHSVDIIGFLSPRDDYQWFNYTDQSLNVTHAHYPEVDGHKPIYNHTPSALFSGWSPLVNFTGVSVPETTRADRYRDYAELSNLLENEPDDFNTTVSEFHFVMVEEIVPDIPYRAHADPVEFEKKETWFDDQLVEYYDFGEATDQVQKVYQLVYENGQPVPYEDQPWIIEKVGGSVFQNTSADAGYSPFMRTVNVTVPDDYTINYINDPMLIDLWDLPTEETDDVWNCPLVPKGSTLENNPFTDVGPYGLWYNMQEVKAYCFGPEMVDPDTLFDPVSEKVNTMDAGLFNASGQRPVVEHYNGSFDYSPLWDTSYLEPRGAFVEDSVRNISTVNDIISDPAGHDFDVGDGPLMNRPIVSEPVDGPTMFDMMEGVEYEAMSGWYEGNQVRYYDLDESSNSTATIYRFYHLNASDDNSTPVEGQKHIVNNIPDGVYTDIQGDSGYTGFWRETKVLVDEDYEPNTIKSRIGIQQSGFTTVQTREIMMCPLVPRDTNFSYAPWGPSLEQYWFKNNPVYSVCLEPDLDPGTYRAAQDKLDVNTVYTFPEVENQSVIFDLVKVGQEANYTGLWTVQNVSVPDEYMANEIRDAATIQALLDDPGSGYTYNEEGMVLWPQVGGLITEGIAPQARAGEDMTTKQGVPVSLNASASSDNVGIASYTWSFLENGSEVTLDGVMAEHTFSHMGDFEVTLTVEDSEGLTDNDTLMVTVLDGLAPEAEAGEDRTVELGDALIFDAGASSDNVAIDGYMWDFGDNYTAEGQEVNHTYAAIGEYTVTLNVTDAEGNWAIDTLAVTVVEANQPPVIDPISDTDVTEGTTFTLTVSASDPNNDTITFSLEEGPLGMVIDDSTGQITFTPTAAMVGDTYTVEIMASDGKDNITRSFHLTVIAAIPETISVTIGPIKDDDGDPVKNADVEVTYGSDSHMGKTGANGEAGLSVPGTWMGKSVSVTVEKNGFKSRTFTGIVNEDGSFSPDGGSYPTMKKKAEDTGDDTVFFVVAIVILIVLAIVLLSMRRPIEEEEIYEDDELWDAEEDEEDEDLLDEEE